MARSARRGKQKFFRHSEWMYRKEEEEEEEGEEKKKAVPSAPVSVRPPRFSGGLSSARKGEAKNITRRPAGHPREIEGRNLCAVRIDSFLPSFLHGHSTLPRGVDGTLERRREAAKREWEQRNLNAHRRHKLSPDEPPERKIHPWGYAPARLRKVKNLTPATFQHVRFSRRKVSRLPFLGAPISLPTVMRGQLKRGAIACSSRKLSILPSYPLSSSPTFVPPFVLWWTLRGRLQCTRRKAINIWDCLHGQADGTRRRR